MHTMKNMTLMKKLFIIWTIRDSWPVIDKLTNVKKTNLLSTKAILKPQKVPDRQVQIIGDKCKVPVQDQRQKQKQVSRQKIPDAIRQMKTPFDKAKFTFGACKFRQIDRSTFSTNG